MKLAVLADNSQWEELMSLGKQETLEILRLEGLHVADDIDIYLDLLFDGSERRSRSWKVLTDRPVILNAVETAPEGFIRINGWPGFLGRPIIEASAPLDQRPAAESLFSLLNRKAEWVPDVPGFVSPRVISMIINEAYLSLEEGVAEPAAIDTAMKLGTNYPYGPFEWAERIGLKKIHSLLAVLALKEERYKPSALLEQKALQ